MTVSGAERSIVSETERFIVSEAERLRLGRSSGGNTAGLELAKPLVKPSTGSGLGAVETAV